MFRPAKSDRVDDGIGDESASHLAGVIATRINEVMLGLSKLRFVEYSAHDTTILALASILGIDIDAPDFLGHFTFELYRRRSREELPTPWMIRVGYDPSPHSVRSVRLGRSVVSFVVFAFSYFSRTSTLEQHTGTHSISLDQTSFGWNISQMG